MGDKERALLPISKCADSQAVSEAGRMVPILTQLLSTATEAQGDFPPDPSKAKMSSEDRTWLENALKELSTDPVKKMKNIMDQLSRYKSAEDITSKESGMQHFYDMFEDLNDLVCDMDLALDFCKLEGLQLVRNFLDFGSDGISIAQMNLIAVISQHNPRVQERTRREFLDRILDDIIDDQKSADYKRKCLYALSSIVKAYLPALSQFARKNGSDSMLKCFQHALEKNHEQVAERCALAAISIFNSYPREFLERDKFVQKVIDLPGQLIRVLETNELSKNEDYKRILALLVGEHNETTEDGEEHK